MFMKKHISFLVLFLVAFSQGFITQTDTKNTLENKANSNEIQIISKQHSIPSIDNVFSTKASGDKSWTYMLYLDADNDIEGDAVRDFEWLEQAGGSNENISIVVLFDRIPGFDNTHGNWNGSRIYNITENVLPTTIDSQLMVDLGEVDMANPASLTDFISYCFENFPAENYILDLWNHGHAAYGVIDDETSSTHFIVNDIQLAITNALAAYEEEINIISMDACDMNTIEVAWEMRNLCDYFITTEDGTNGYPYNSIIQKLKLQPNLNASLFCELIVDAYSIYYQNTYKNCLSVIDQTKLLGIPEVINPFISELITTLEAGYYDEIFAFSRDLTYDFYDECWVDLVALIKNIIFFLDEPSLNLVGRELLDYLDQVITYNWQHPNYGGSANGLTIFLPDGTIAMESIEGYNSGLSFTEDMDWLTDTLWDEFLDFYKSNYLYLKTVNPEMLSLEEVRKDCSIVQNSVQMFKINLWKKAIYEFACQISSGDIDFKVMKYDLTGIYKLIGGSFFINPEDATSEIGRYRLETGFYLILVYGKASTSNFDIEVKECEPIELVCNSPYTSTGGSMNGDTQGHFKQDLNHYFQIGIPYGNNTITLSNSETANYQLTIYDETWKKLFFIQAEGFGKILTLEYNQTSESPTTFFLEIYDCEGYGEFTIEIKNPNEPTPNVSFNVWNIIFFLPIIIIISKAKFIRKNE
ncbi:MAG TPA: clostripain-related cysteine peptidase [Candidatus Bathyarchaeia archaeon]|nr:clostripain-related cysteine peptidase [Candidatus Bathyarchaeia archaeon]